MEETKQQHEVSYTIAQPFCSVSASYIIEELHFLSSVKLSFSLVPQSSSYKLVLGDRSDC